MHGRLDVLIRTQVFTNQIGKLHTRLWLRVIGLQGLDSTRYEAFGELFKGEGIALNIARKLSAVGGSLGDVMVLAGHRNLQTTQRYVDHDPLAQQKLVQCL